jgi:HNH endonuclease
VTALCSGSNMPYRKRSSFTYYPSKRKKSWNRLSIAAEYKIKLKRQGKLYCWICGWKDPLTLPFFLIEIHHVVQVSNKGTHDENNLLPCCPNCHRIADRISKQHSNLPLTVPILIALIREHEFNRQQRTR